MAKQYSKQFKNDALTYVHDHPDLSVNACAKNLGISTSALHNWLKKAQEGIGIHRGAADSRRF